MAHFYGKLQGSRGETTRLGTKDSGLVMTAASYEGAVLVELYHDNMLGCNAANIRLTPWQGHGVARQLWSGRVDGHGPNWPSLEVVTLRRELYRLIQDRKGFTIKSGIEYDEQEARIKFIGQRLMELAEKSNIVS